MRDSNGYIHDKIPSNNPLIYTGIHRVVNGYEDYKKEVFYRDNFVHMPMTHEIVVIRKMSKGVEPTSLDEIIGAHLLGLLNCYHFMENWTWALHTNAPWYRVAQAAIYCLGKHRNFFKEKEVDDLRQVAFWIPWNIQYWSLKREGERTNVLQFTHFYLWLAVTFLKSNDKHGNVSQKNIAYAILKDMKSPLAKFINYKKHLIAYFGENHLITEAL